MPADCGRVARREDPRSYSFGPATTIGQFDRRSGPACTVSGYSGFTDHPDRSRRAESLRPTSGHGVRPRALRPLSSGTTAAYSRWTASGAAIRRRPAGSHFTSCAVKVLRAAITVTTIRDDRISNGGAGRERTKLESAVDRPRERKSTNRKRAAPAADTDRGGRCRSAARERPSRPIRANENRISGVGGAAPADPGQSTNSAQDDE